MNLTIKKLIKILLNDKKYLVIFLFGSILFYPIYYFSFKLISPKVILTVDTMYNYTIPNSISSLLSDTFTSHLKDRIEKKDFLKNDLKCILTVNESTRKKNLECISPKKNKDEQIKNFEILINKIYSEHIENLYSSIKYAPPTFLDIRSGFKNEINNDQNLIFLNKEKDLKFYLNIEIKDQEKIFNFAHYIVSFILIFFLNIFRVILKY
jgi:hypothetical protein